jgi:hypothetical protein
LGKDLVILLGGVLSNFVTKTKQISISDSIVRRYL